MNQPKKHKKSKKPREPELLDHSNIDIPGNNRSPYIYLAFIGFVILTVIWKGFIKETPPDGVQEPRTISERELVRPVDLVK